MNNLVTLGALLVKWLAANIVPVSIVVLVIFGAGTATGTTLVAIDTIAPALTTGADQCGTSSTRATSMIRNTVIDMPEGPDKDKYSSQLETYGKSGSTVSVPNDSGMEGQVDSCGRMPLIMGDGVITWPLPGQRINERYPCYGLPYSCSPHTGMDIGGPYGTPVLASITGTVVAVNDGAKDYACNAWISNIFACPFREGNFVKIKHSDGWVYWYHHLKEGSVIPKIGDYVTAGTMIGQQGSSGLSTGAHLHLELRDASGKLQDPLKYLHDNGCQNCPL